MKNEKKQVTLGVDIGGSHICIGVFDPLQDVPLLIESIYAQVDSSKSQQEILDSWKQVFIQVKLKYKLQKVGIAFPAPFDYSNGICLIEQQGKFRSLFGLNLKRVLAELLELVEGEIHFLNDAEAYLRGELAIRKVDLRRVLLLTFGTGLGSAWKLGEEIADAGLWSSTFKDSIAESYIGTAWFINYSYETYGISIPHVKALVETPALHKFATQIFEEFAANLAAFITTQWQKQQFEALVLGGNISKAHPWFLPALENILTQSGIHLSILLSELGEQAPLYGAANFAELNPK